MGRVGANKAFTINVTIWSPYGVVDIVELNISDVAKYLYNGSLYETYDPNNLFEPVGYSLTTNGGWVYFTLELKPSWGAGGTYDVWVYAEDAVHAYSNSSTYLSLFSVVNTTYLYSYSFNKTTFFPNDPARLTLNVAYNNTSVGAEGETLWVNGTQLTTDPTGVAYYDFIVPSVAGTYTLNVTLAHGETYFINFTVSEIILHLYTRTTANETIHLPSDLLVRVYNYTTSELLREYAGREAMDIYLNVTGVYLIRVYYHGILIAEVVHNQTELEQSLTLTPIKQVRDYLGRLRGLLSNATLTSYSYDNATRKLHVELAGSGVGRLIYIVNYTKPLLVLTNTTIVNEQHLDGEVVIDVEAPADVTIIDPRRLRVTVVNPFNISYTPTIEFLNGTVWEALTNATLYEVPAYVETQFRASFKGVEVKKVAPLVDDLNITLVLSFTNFTDYKGLTRELVANMSVTYESLSAKFPYSRMRVLVSGVGGFRVRLYLPSLPSKLAVDSNTTVTWWLEGNWLTIEGTLHSTSEVNVTDLYRLRIEAYDRLGNLMPVPLSIFINDTKYVGNIVEEYLYPEDYVVKLPALASGFDFYSFFDGFNESVRHLTVNDSDVLLKAWYRVPSSMAEVEFKLAGEELLSSLLRLLGVEAGEEVEAYVEGYLRDYYGSGIPGRRVTVNVTNVETGFTQSIATTTDVSGYFRAGPFTLVRGKDYEVRVVYEGDDVYVESLYTFYTTVEALPPAPVEVVKVPTIYIVAAIVAAVVVIAVAVYAWRAAKHAVVEEVARRRRFVRRKR